MDNRSSNHIRTYTKRTKIAGAIFSFFPIDFLLLMNADQAEEDKRSLLADLAML